MPPCAVFSRPLFPSSGYTARHWSVAEVEGEPGRCLENPVHIAVAWAPFSFVHIDERRPEVRVVHAGSLALSHRSGPGYGWTGAARASGVASSGVSERERSRYRLISADSHVNEPGDLWTADMKRYAHRAPRIQSFEQGDAQVLDGVTTRSTSMNAQRACRRADDRLEALRIHAGGYDPAAPRGDGPGTASTPRCCIPHHQSGRVRHEDPGFHHTLYAHNDWLAEYVSYAPTDSRVLRPEPRRRRGVAKPSALRATGIRRRDGLVIRTGPQRRAGGRRVFGHLPRRDPAVDSCRSRKRCRRRTVLPFGYGRFFDAPNWIVELIFAGVFDRFPLWW